MSRDIEEKPQAVAESSKEKELLAPEDASSSKKERGRGLLHVPSRSSSQRIQPSPTSGLSGATASERDSIGGQSKESKGSMLGRRRNGSASSNQSGIGTGPTTTPGNSLPNSPGAATHNKKKKSGGLLALFNCCGVPNHANGLDATEDAPHKVEKLAPRPTTASRRTVTPQDQPSSSKTQLYEKETQQQTAQNTPEHSKTGKRESGTSSQDQSTVGERDAESKQTTLVGNSTAPTVTVDPPNAASSETTEPTTTAVIEAEEPHSDVDAEGDVGMPDADAAPKQTAKQPAAGNADQPYTSLPPPPPGPVPAVPNPPTGHLNESMPVFAPDQPQKFLLPPQAPEFKGKKCLVLDLDETLVHSSFKV
jgi:RNA polymerase II subunit A small phosphatase-like protein